MNAIEDAIQKGYAKEYYGAYIIYPRKIMSTYYLNKLLVDLKNEYDFFQIFDSIKAVKKVG